MNKVVIAALQFEHEIFDFCVLGRHVNLGQLHKTHKKHGYDCSIVQVAVSTVYQSHH